MFLLTEKKTAFTYDVVRKPHQNIQYISYQRALERIRTVL